MEEIWKDIKGYEELYQVSNLGRIKSFPRKGTHTKKEHVLKPELTKKGYLRIQLSKKGKHKKYLVHVLVAKTFISNSQNKQQVNHIDGNKQNNCISNLEWNTQEENMQHAFRNNLINRPTGQNNWKSVKVNQYDLDGNFIKMWYCLADIEKKLKISSRNICSCCKKKRKIAGGFKWEYALTE